MAELTDSVFPSNTRESDSATTAKIDSKSIGKKGKSLALTLVATNMMNAAMNMLIAYRMFFLLFILSSLVLKKSRRNTLYLIVPHLAPQDKTKAPIVAKV